MVVSHFVEINQLCVFVKDNLHTLHRGERNFCFFVKDAVTRKTFFFGTPPKIDIEPTNDGKIIFLFLFGVKKLSGSMFVNLPECTKNLCHLHV